MMLRKTWVGMFATLLTVALFMTVGVSAASAQAQMMPDRDAVSGTTVVVWGNTLGGEGTYQIKSGNTAGDETLVIALVDPSYIAATFTYTTALAQEDFTARLFLDGVEKASVKITAFNSGLISAEELRGIKVNQAIEDGLRWLYFAQISRQANFGGTFNLWNNEGGQSRNIAYNSMVVLAFENHGYTVTSGDIYSPVVQAGLNHIFNRLRKITLSAAGQTGNPCLGVPIDADVCTGLYTTNNHPPAYATPIAVLSVAASGAPLRKVGDLDGNGTVDVVLGAFNGNFVSGRTYLEIAQRITNTVVWAQDESPASDRGGWRYSLNVDNDGSTNGWGALALLDANAFGVTIPTFVASELEFGTATLSLGDGSMGYTGKSAQNTAKAGVRMQALHLYRTLTGDVLNLGDVPPSGGPAPQTTVNYINAGWRGRNESFECSGVTTLAPWNTNVNDNNFGCLYAMFNVFKGLKLYGVAALPAADTRTDKDWHKEYQDYLVAKQTSPTSPTLGHWGTLDFSCCDNNTIGESALAELILSPVALILPTSLTLGPPDGENLLGEDHELTVTALSASNAPVAGATVTFEVIAGPNLGELGTAVTDASGVATFSYTSALTGEDTIVAKIGGSLISNEVTKTWVPPNKPPTVTLELTSGTECGSDVTLLASPDDPDLPDDTLTLSWEHDGNPLAETGASLTLSGLSVGSHTVTVTVTDSFGETASASVTFDVEDTTPPVIDESTVCNALTMTPPDAPKTFTGADFINPAGVSDACSPDLTFTVTGFDCWMTNGAGKRVDKTESCVVDVSNGVLTVLDSGGVGDHIDGIVTITDPSGNSSETTCSIFVENPSGNTDGGEVKGNGKGKGNGGE